MHVRRQVQRLDNGEIIVKAPKTGSARSVSLPPVIQAMAAHMATFTGPGMQDYVLTRPQGGPIHHLYVNRDWRKAREEVAAHDEYLPRKVHFYDLRDQKELMDLLGHSTPAVALRYQHATDPRRKTLSASLGRVIDEAVDPWV